jgi:hypothetical protein
MSPDERKIDGARRDHSHRQAGRYWKSRSPIAMVLRGRRKAVDTTARKDARRCLS